MWKATSSPLSALTNWLVSVIPLVAAGCRLMMWWTVPVPGNEVPKDGSSETAKMLATFLRCEMTLMADFVEEVGQ
jgi:hypothetical protein